MFIYSKLRKEIKINPDLKYFNYFFLFLGLATVSGGVLGHGLQHYLHFDWKMVGWLMGTLALFNFERATVSVFKDKLGPGLAQSIWVIIHVQLFTTIGLLLMPYTRSFSVVQINSAFSYVGVILPLFIISYFKWDDRSVKGVILSIFWLFLVSFVYNQEVRIHKWFDHHVLTHLLMTLFVLFMYRSVVVLQEQKVKPFLH